MHSSEHANSASTGRDASVIATNDDAFMCKVAAVKQGYFADDFLQAIAESAELGDGVCSPRRPPIINRGTFARMRVVEQIVELFLKDVSSGGEAQIISFGAGHDTLPFRLVESVQHASVVFLELDFPSVTRSKCEIVDNVPRISDLFKEASVDNATGSAAKKYFRMKSEHSFKYILQGCDLRDTDGVNAAFDACGINFTAPTLFLTECVLMYMTPAASDALLRCAATRFTGPRCFANYEPINPSDPFGRQMIANIAARGSPLLGIAAYPDENAQKKRFRDSGWPHADAANMLVAFDRMFDQRSRLALNRIEPLDEMEEWNLIMSHYVVVFARSTESISRHSLFELAASKD